MYIFVGLCQNILSNGGDIMKDSMILGLALGFIAGSLLVTNNMKFQQIVEKGKKAVKENVKKIVE
jgi:hypothetical protein